MSEDQELAAMARQLDHLAMDVMKEAADTLREERDALKAKLATSEAQVEAMRTTIYWVIGVLGGLHEHNRDLCGGDVCNVLKRLDALAAAEKAFKTPSCCGTVGHSWDCAPAAAEGEK